VSKYKIIADSGSTKTDWVVVNEEKNTRQTIKSIGFNPYFHTTDFIYNELREPFKEAGIDRYDIGSVHFYGAGCSSVDKVQIVKKALLMHFPSAAIHIDHDLIASARATLGDDDGIACILGTGSNSCVWKDAQVVENVPSHGYIFGDEGSGSHLGINLIKLYLKDRLDSGLTKEFEDEYNLTKTQIINKTYREKNPNVFLASFAAFYGGRVDKCDILRETMVQEFNDFFKERVVCYTDYKSYDLGFVGSIAFHNQEILREVATSYGVSIKSISKCPIDALVDYHVNQLVK
jgi:glucosamine kinase